MVIRLSRPEFIALAVMLGADGVFGIDPAIMPANQKERQALYDAGERRLHARGMLRESAAASVTLEQNLLRIGRTMANPELAIRCVRTAANGMQQLFLHYGRDSAYVEQTLPDADSHQLSDVGNADELLNRLGQIAPVSDTAQLSEQVGLYDARLIIAVYNLFQSNGIKDARDALRDNGALDTATEAWLASLSKKDYSCTFEFFRIIPGAEVTPAETALFVGGGAAWLFVPAANGQAQLANVDADALRVFLSQLLGVVARA